MRLAFLAIFFGLIGVGIAQTVTYTCKTPTSCTEQDVYTKPVNMLNLTAQIKSLTARLQQLQEQQSQVNAASAATMPPIINQQNGVI